MPRDRAAYMRDYRAKQRVESPEFQPGAAKTLALQTRINDLEEEVRRLKRELAEHAEVAQRWSLNARPVMPGFGAPRPAPKPGKKG